MTKEDLLRILERCAARSEDEETAHRDADYALLDYIDDDDISKAYLKITRWYA